MGKQNEKSSPSDELVHAKYVVYVVEHEIINGMVTGTWVRSRYSSCTISAISTFLQFQLNRGFFDIGVPQAALAYVTNRQSACKHLRIRNDLPCLLIFRFNCL